MVHVGHGRSGDDAHAFGHELVEDFDVRRASLAAGVGRVDDGGTGLVDSKRSSRRQAQPVAEDDRTVARLGPRLRRDLRQTPAVELGLQARDRRGVRRLLLALQRPHRLAHHQIQRLRRAVLVQEEGADQGGQAAASGIEEEGAAQVAHPRARLCLLREALSHRLVEQRAVRPIAREGLAVRVLDQLALAAGGHETQRVEGLRHLQRPPGLRQRRFGFRARLRRRREPLGLRHGCRRRRQQERESGAGEHHVGA
jgi:hypothetical protein